MDLAPREGLGRFYSLTMVKSFLIWCFTLTVCLLVVGFPLGVLVVTGGALLAITLQTVLPASAVLLVSGGIVGINVLIVLLGATFLTLKGVHPQDVSWLRWLNGTDRPMVHSIYASCPLTCNLVSE